MGGTCICDHMASKEVFASVIILEALEILNPIVCFGKYNYVI